MTHPLVSKRGVCSLFDFTIIILRMGLSLEAIARSIL